MKSKIKVVGHPIHPILVSFPITLYVATAICYITYQVRGDAFWFQMGYIANVAGVIMAALAAVPGLIDWAFAIPNENPAKKTGLVHMILNVGALILFAGNAWMQAGQWDEIQPSAAGAISFSVVGVLLTVAAGLYGWNLVQKHHVGIDMTAEQTRLEPADPEKVFAYSRKSQAG